VVLGIYLRWESVHFTVGSGIKGTGKSLGLIHIRAVKIIQIMLAEVIIGVADDDDDDNNNIQRAGRERERAGREREREEGNE